MICFAGCPKGDEMAKFTIRRLSKYKDVYIEHDNVTLQIGLLDEKEQQDLAVQLREAAEDLWPVKD